MTDEMNKKEEMYEEVELLIDLTHLLPSQVAAELAEKNAELEATASRLSETEHSLSCTRTVLHQTALEKEEQRWLH